MKRFILKSVTILTTTAISIGVATTTSLPAFAASYENLQTLAYSENGYDDYRITHEGTCGIDYGDNVTYTMYGNGLLVLRGKGKMDYYADDDYEKERYAYVRPWNFGVGGKNWSDEIKVVRIENGITNIGAGAFSDCKNLTRVEIPDSVKEIGNLAFSNCKNLKNVTLPSGITRIGKRAFDNTGLETVTIPSGLKVIEESSFSGCPIANLVIPEGVTTIQNSAFGYNDKLTAVSLPSSLTSIGKYVFSGSPNLTHIDLAAQNPTYTIIEGSIYTKDGTELVALNPSISGVYTIPNGTKRIAEGAVAVRYLEGLILPDSVESVATYAFYTCPNLKAVYIPTSVTSMGSKLVSTFLAYNGTMYIDVNPFILYSGTEAQWNSINGGLPPTLNAEMFYNTTPDNVAYVVQKFGGNASTQVYDAAGGFFYDPLAEG